MPVSAPTRDLLVPGLERERGITNRQQAARAAGCLLVEAHKAALSGASRASAASARGTRSKLKGVARFQMSEERAVLRLTRGRALLGKRFSAHARGLLREHA